MNSPLKIERPSKRVLPLMIITPDSWADHALSDVGTLLNDHAHLERKAALNALELLTRWDGRTPDRRWTRVLASVARDETSHLSTVLRQLQLRGLEMSKAHKSSYAQALHRLVRRGRGPLELIDRLIISALIEARSCERFEILARKAKEQPLSKLYAALWASEHGHYQVFLGLAMGLGAREAVDRRWEQMLESEAEIIRNQSDPCSLHGWVAL